MHDWKKKLEIDRAEHPVEDFSNVVDQNLQLLSNLGAKKSFYFS